MLFCGAPYSIHADFSSILASDEDNYYLLIYAVLAKDIYLVLSIPSDRFHRLGPISKAQKV